MSQSFYKDINIVKPNYSYESYKETMLYIKKMVIFREYVREPEIEEAILLTKDQRTEWTR